MPKEEEIKELKEIMEHMIDEMAKIQNHLELVTLKKATFDKGKVADYLGALAEGATVLKQRVSTMDGGAPDFLRCLEQVGTQPDQIQRLAKNIAQGNEDLILATLKDSIIGGSQWFWRYESHPDAFRKAWQLILPLRQKLTITEIPVAVYNTRFNPDMHEMVGTSDGHLPPATIVQLVRPGFMYTGRVIVKANVVVQK